MQCTDEVLSTSSESSACEAHGDTQYGAFSSPLPSAHFFFKLLFLFVISLLGKRMHHSLWRLVLAPLYTQVCIAEPCILNKTKKKDEFIARVLTYKLGNSRLWEL